MAYQPQPPTQPPQSYSNMNGSRPTPTPPLHRQPQGPPPGAVGGHTGFTPAPPSGPPPQFTPSSVTPAPPQVAKPSPALGSGVGGFHGPLHPNSSVQPTPPANYSNSSQAHVDHYQSSYEVSSNPAPTAAVPTYAETKEDPPLYHDIYPGSSSTLSGSGLTSRSSVARRSGSRETEMREYPDYDDANKYNKYQPIEENVNLERKDDGKGESGQFSGAQFQHNSRMWGIVLPCALILLAFGGKVTLGLSILGLMTSYILDAAGLRESTFIAFWVTIVSVGVSFTYSTVHLFSSLGMVAVCVLLNSCAFIALMGYWGSLQFHWLIKQSPKGVLAIEQLLFATLPYPSVTIISWGVIAMSGLDNFPLYMLFIFAFMVYTVGVPIPSSFSKTKANICTRMQNALLVFSMVNIPMLTYICIHRHNLFTLWNLINVVILIQLPLLLLWCMRKRNPLWFLGLGDDNSKKLLNAGAFTSVFILLGCFEYRVIFMSYHYYIRIPAPWSYILVTIGLYTTVGVLAAHLFGFKEVVSRTVLTTFAILGAFAASIVIGLKWYLIIFPLIGAYSLVTFYFDRQFSHYFMFVVASTITLMWFVYRTFWFLNFNFESMSMNVQQASLLLVAFFVLSMLIPGLTLVNEWGFLNGLVLIVHGACLCLLEQILYGQFGDIYSPWMVMFTSFVGAWLAYRLGGDKRIAPETSWVLMSVYISKLAVLLVDVRYGQASALMLILSISPLYMKPSDQRYRMSFRKAIANGLFVGVVTFFTRNTILAKLAEVILQEPPSSGLKFAVFLVTWSVGCMPLPTRYLKNNKFVRDVIVSTFAVGVLFGFMQPEMDMQRVAYSVSESISGATAGAYEPRPSWAPWCLVFAFIVAVSALSKQSELGRQPGARLVVAVTIGTGVGLYISGMFIPRSGMLYVLFTLVFICVSVFTVFTHWPSGHSHLYQTTIYRVFLALFPVIFLVQGKVFLYSAGVRGQANLLLSRLTLVSIYAFFNIVIGLTLKIEISNKNVFEAEAKQRARHTKTQVQGSGSYNRASTDLDWMPEVGNIATIIGLTLCLVLNEVYLEGSETAVFVLSPILLFLNQDVKLAFFKDLTDQRRYYPVTTMISVYLTCSTMYSALVWHGFTLSFLTVLPAYAANLFMNKFLWDYEKQPDMVWVCLLPACLLPLIFGPLSSIMLLAAFGIAGGCFQLYTARSIHVKGLKYI